MIPYIVQLHLEPVAAKFNCYYFLLADSPAETASPVCMASHTIQLYYDYKLSTPKPANDRKRRKRSQATDSTTPPAKLASDSAQEATAGVTGDRRPTTA